jgi:hypothetical protein
MDNGGLGGPVPAEGGRQMLFAFCTIFDLGFSRMAHRNRYGLFVSFCFSKFSFSRRICFAGMKFTNIITDNFLGFSIFQRHKHLPFYVFFIELAACLTEVLTKADAPADYH